MDLKSMGIEVLAPDINRSTFSFRILDKAILFGLGSIKGIGEAAASIIREREKNGLYQSLADFVLRTQVSKNILETFIDSGAFDSLCENRRVMGEAVPEYLKLMKKIKDYQKRLVEERNGNAAVADDKKIFELKKRMREKRVDLSICENPIERLMAEKRVLGIFASKHPMELFPHVKTCGAVEIGRVPEYRSNRNITVAGIVSDFKICFRKQDSAEMGFFILSDQTGEIEVCCFASAFMNAKEILKEDAVIKLTGSIMYDKSDGGRKKISVHHVEVLRPAEQVITVYAKLYLAGIDEEYGELWNLLKPYISNHGMPMRFYDTLMDEFRETNLRLSMAILQDERIRTSLHQFM